MSPSQTPMQLDDLRCQQHDTSMEHRFIAIVSDHRNCFTATIVGVVLFFGGAMLVAQQPRESKGVCSPGKLHSLLPSLQVEQDPEEGKALLPGVSNIAPPSNLKIKVDPDSFKTLLGYSGPFFNTDLIDGRVAVLEDTVYTWPQKSWQVTGLIRNQSCSPIRIVSLSAHLLGSSGKSIGVVTADVPLSEVRPGEPVPFIAGAFLNRSDVKSIEWNVQYIDSSPTAQRNFAFDLYEARAVSDGSAYSLFGTLKNVGSDTADKARVLAAWLDADGRVIHVAFPSLRLISDPSQVRDTVQLTPNDLEDFFYTSNDSTLISRLHESGVAIWGVSN